MSNRKTTPLNKQLPSWRADHELRLRSRERNSGAPGSSFAIPFHVGRTTIDKDNQGELIKMDVFRGEVLRARRGDPVTTRMRADLDITGTTYQDALDVTFETYRDNALVEFSTFISFRLKDANIGATLTNDHLFLVWTYTLDGAYFEDHTLGVAPLGPTGYNARAVTATQTLAQPVRLAGVHKAHLMLRLAAVGAVDDVTVEADWTRASISIYEVIG